MRTGIRFVTATLALRLYAQGAMHGFEEILEAFRLLVIGLLIGGVSLAVIVLFALVSEFRTTRHCWRARKSRLGELGLPRVSRRSSKRPNVLGAVVVIALVVLGLIATHAISAVDSGVDEPRWQGPITIRAIAFDRCPNAVGFRDVLTTRVDDVLDRQRLESDRMQIEAALQAHGYRARVETDVTVVRGSAYVVFDVITSRR